MNSAGCVFNCIFGEQNKRKQNKQTHKQKQKQNKEPNQNKINKKHTQTKLQQLMFTITYELTVCW